MGAGHTFGQYATVRREELFEMAIDPLTALSLTKQQATELVARNTPIHLPSLQTLCPWAAGVLATSNYGIVLQSLPALTLTAAEALASHKWGLHLTGLVIASREVGDALATHAGTLEFSDSLKELHSPLLARRIAKDSGEDLRLDGLERLTPEIARALAYYRDNTEVFPSISLNGLRYLSAETAAELVESFWSITLHGLSDGRCTLGDGADAVLAENDECTRRLFVGHDIAGFMSRNYAHRLLRKVIGSLNSADEDGHPLCNYLDLDSISYITKEQAEAICVFDGRSIGLRGLSDIPHDIARTLASWIGQERYVRINPKRLVDPVLANICLHDYSDCEEPDAFFSDCAIEEISPAAAAVFVEAGATLSFPKMRRLSVEVAKTLATTENELRLDGLEVISHEVAIALAEHQHFLSLDGLESISTETAKALAKHQGAELSLRGLASFTPEVAAALAEYKGELHLHELAYPLASAAMELLRRQRGS